MAEDGFLHFRKLITNTIIKTVYVLGVMLCLLSGLFAALIPFTLSSEPRAPNAEIKGIILGLAIAIGGNLIWRLICEGWIILFSIHEILASIEDTLKLDNEAAEQRKYIAELLRATEANTEHRHDELLAAIRARGIDPENTIVNTQSRRS
jgi:hypothetical protein